MKKSYRKDPYAMWKVIQGSTPYHDDDVTKLMLPLRFAFEALRRGTATLSDAFEISNAINDTAVRSWGLEDEDAANTAGPIADTAIGAMRRCAERYKRTGKLGLDGPGIGDVAAGLDLYEQLVRLSTPAQMMAAASTAIRLLEEQTA
jgi:hypothetical protein